MHADVKHLGSQPVLLESVPVLLVGGRLVLQLAKGSLESVILETHKPLEVAFAIKSPPFPPFSAITGLSCPVLAAHAMQTQPCITYGALFQLTEQCGTTQ